MSPHRVGQGKARQGIGHRVFCEGGLLGRSRLEKLTVSNAVYENATGRLKGAAAAAWRNGKGRVGFRLRWLNGSTPRSSRPSEQWPVPLRSYLSFARGDSEHGGRMTEESGNGGGAAREKGRRKQAALYEQKSVGAFLYNLL
ncbi:hypothetical protein V490_03845 [Pseudogymnoascus sp. VKM F-3557]|nr:hypothetical protein V490_03845 [Pseudogymnoascus sp. VKM F-3557]